MLHLAFDLGGMVVDIDASIENDRPCCLRRRARFSIDRVGRHVERRRHDIAGDGHYLHDGAGGPDRRRDDATAAEAGGPKQECSGGTWKLARSDREERTPHAHPS